MSPAPAGGDPRCQAPPTVSEVKDETGTRGIEVVFAVDAPPDALLGLLWDVGNFPRLFPDIKAYAVVGQAEGDPPRSLDISYRIDAVVKELHYVLRRVLDPAARSITWTELSGDLRRVRGGWWVDATDRPDVSMATYRAFVDVGRFVPTALVAKAAKKKAAEMVTRIRAFASERGGAPAEVLCARPPV